MDADLLENSKQGSKGVPSGSGSKFPFKKEKQPVKDTGGGFQAATGGLTPAPNSPILTMKHGFHYVRKSSDPSGEEHSI